MKCSPHIYSDFIILSPFLDVVILLSTFISTSMHLSLLDSHRNYDNLFHKIKILNVRYDFRFY